MGALLRKTFDFLGEFHNKCQPGDSQFDLLTERAVQQEMALVLLRWLKRARLAGMCPGLRLELVAFVISWAIFGPAVHWSRNEHTPSAEEMTNQILQVITEGLAHLAPSFFAQGADFCVSQISSLLPPGREAKKDQIW